MATNPEQVLGPTPERLAADQARARQLADFRALVAEGRAKMREAVNSRQATFDQLNEIAQAYGMKPLTDRAAVEVSLAFAANPANDPNRVQIITEAITPEGDSVPTGEVALAVQPEAAPPPPQLSALEAMAQAYRENAGDVGLDREYLRMFGAEPGNTQGLMGLTNSLILSPVSLAHALVTEPIMAGVPALFTGIGQGLSNTDIGGRSALQRLGDVMMPGVKATPENFARDFTEATDIAGLVAGGSPMPPVSLGTLRRMRNLPPAPPRAAAAAPEVPPVPPRAAAAAPEVPPVPPRAAAAAPEVPTPPRVSAEQRAEDIVNLETAPIDETQRIVSPARREQIAAYQQEYAQMLQDRGFSRPKNMSLSEWLQVHMGADSIPVEELLPVWERHGISSIEDQLTAAGISRESLSRAGRELNKMSQLGRMLERVAAENPAAARQLGIANSVIKEARSTYHRLMGVESGLLTAQMKTTARNIWGATPIMPTYSMIEELTDAGIRAARNVNRAPEDKLLGPGAWDVVYSYLEQVGGPLVNAVRGAVDKSLGLAGKTGITNKRLAPSTRQLRERKTIEALQDAFPDRFNTLFGRYASDQVRRGPTDTLAQKGVGGLESAADFVNIANKVGDRWVKNVQFPSILDLELRRIGRSLDEYLDTDTFNEIPKNILDNAIRRMHKRVFEDRPEGSEWYNRASDALITVMNYSTRPAGLTPYPNFWVSLGKHLFETSPAALVRFASKAERKRIADGDARAVGKIAAGVGVTLGYLVTSDFDEPTEWYETTNSDGEVVDLSAASAPTLLNKWEAYLIHMAMNDRLDEVRWGRDINKIFGTSNLRGGFSGYMIDSGFREVVDAAERGDSADKVEGIARRYLTDRVGSWSLVMRNLRDPMAATGAQDMTQRQPESPLQSTMMNLPFGSEMYTGMTGQEIPARYAPTREGPVQEANPLLSQVTGALIRTPRNPIEERLIQLGVSASDINRKSGISDTYDRLLTAEIGDIAQNQLGPLLDERVDPNAVSERQRIQLREEYTGIRGAAKDRVLRDYPIYRLASRYARQSRDERRLEDRRNIEDPQRGRSVPDFVREVESVDPRMPVVRRQGGAREGDLSRVPSGARYADLLTFTIKTKE